MKPPLKALLFSIWFSVTSLALVGKWIETGSFFRGLIFVGQIYLIFGGSMFLLILGLFLGNIFFGDK